MESNDALIDHLVNTGVLYDETVIKAMKAVDRALFVPKLYMSNAYDDKPLPIGGGQTISAPHMVAIMTQHMSVSTGDKIFEVGTGSGYQAAILAELAEPGQVYTMERVRPLADNARTALKPWVNVHVLFGNASRGYKKEAPFDKIIVTCAAPSVMKALWSQLKEGGKMILPIGMGLASRLTMIKKVAGNIQKIDLNCSCVFVPLID